MIEVANEYTKVSCFGWQTPVKKAPLQKKELLPKQDNEILAAYFEDTDKQLERQRWPGQEDFKNAAKRMEGGMLESDLVRRVTRINPALFAEDSTGSKGCAAFYWKRAGEKVYTAANWRKGWIPQWTILTTDAADLPTRDGYRPGWRQILQRLIQVGALRRHDVEKAFGIVDLSDLRGRNWHNAVGRFTS